MRPPSLLLARRVASARCPVHGAHSPSAHAVRGVQVRGVHLLRDFRMPSAEELRKKPRLEPNVPNAAEAPVSSHRTMAWTARPTNLLLIQKMNDERTRIAMKKILQHITSRYTHLQLLVEPHTARENPEYENLIVVEPQDKALLPAYTHLVLTLGGDGTVLHTSNLFSQGECPPVLSFSMGSLGFLLPFHIDAMPRALEQTLTGPVTLLNRLRLAVTPFNADGEVLEKCGRVTEDGWQVMNEVTLHRGRYGHLCVVDAYFNGQHLTEAVADGLLISSPTGSTAYSLSAGGPISHPEADALLLTPIAPRSLSFRTVILPGNGTVRLEINPRSRSKAELSIDGRDVCELEGNESVVIRKSPYPIPCIERPGGGTWVRDINSLLQFNVGFKNKSLGPMQQY